MKRLLVVVALAMSACFPGPRELEGFSCEQTEDCLFEFGYACIDAVCQLGVEPDAGPDAGPAPDDAGPDDAG